MPALHAEQQVLAHGERRKDLPVLRHVSQPASGDLMRRTADPTAGWFDGRELKLSAAGDDKSDAFVDPAACVYPDAFLRALAGGRDDCGLLKPGADEYEILTLPFLALSAWVLVICGIAGLHQFYRSWRVWRWLRSMRAQGLVPSGNWRRRLPRRHRRPSRHRRTASRRYAG